MQPCKQDGIWTLSTNQRFKIVEDRRESVLYLHNSVKFTIKHYTIVKLFFTPKFTPFRRNGCRPTRTNSNGEK